jgi:hypothetical protein
MRKILSILLILLTFSSVEAQTFSINETSSFGVASGKDTGNVLDFNGESYDIFVTSTSSEFILCNSSNTHNDYPVWLGLTTDMTYQYNGVEQPIRKSNSGKYFILLEGNSGNPYAKYLEYTD